MNIPQSNPLAGYLVHKNDIDLAVAEVLQSGWYILGSQVKLFEAEFARFVGVEFGIGVNSGTDALALALRACGVKPGDEVITVSHTAVATVAAIEMAGAIPVLVDVDPVTYTIDIASFESAISTKTRAVVPVHLYGMVADIKSVVAIAHRHGIKVVEDCAQAHGATVKGKKVGSWGDCGAFSFYPTKNLGALGDGGMIVTSDAEIAKNAQLLREYGWEKRYVSQVAGVNSRLDELQAAVLRVKLRDLDNDNARRIGHAIAYCQSFRQPSIKLPVLREDGTHVYHQFVIQIDDRDGLKSYLSDNGIGTLIHYPVPVHLQPAYQGRIRTVGRLAVTESLCKKILSLPMYPELENSLIEQVALAISAFYSRGS